MYHRGKANMLSLFFGHFYELQCVFSKKNCCWQAIELTKEPKSNDDMLDIFMSSSVYFLGKLLLTYHRAYENSQNFNEFMLPAPLWHTVLIIKKYLKRRLYVAREAIVPNLSELALSHT